MSCIPDTAKTREMYAQYQSGLSLQQVGAAFGVTRQSVFARFSTAKLVLRSKTFLPFVSFNGDKFTRSRTGYFRKTYGDRESLHRDVWRVKVGPIPEGWDVHHATDDMATTDTALLRCLPKSEHGRLESTGVNQFTPPEIRERIVAEHRARKFGRGA